MTEFVTPIRNLSVRFWTHATLLRKLPPFLSVLEVLPTVKQVEAAAVENHFRVIQDASRPRRPVPTDGSESDIVIGNALKWTKWVRSVGATDTS